MDRCGGQCKDTVAQKMLREICLISFTVFEKQNKKQQQQQQQQPK